MSNSRKMRVYVDFNNCDAHGAIVINTDVPGKEHLKNVLQEMMPVVLYDETLEVDANVKWDSSIRFWMGMPDWKTIHHFTKS